ncbi:MAG: 3'-5' exonuclease [Oscillospiraceae bacterium]|nr:3'-5' exonuclease [Oscillospiraceae bacterium]
MKFCINCGNDIDNDRVICCDCEKNADLEALCERVGRFNAKTCEDYQLLRAAKEFIDPYSVRNLVFPISESLEKSRREYIRLKSMLYFGRLKKESSRWLYEKAPLMLEGNLSCDEKMQVKGALFTAYHYDYDYFKAEEIAEEIICEGGYDGYVRYNLAEYYVNTRRYAQAEDILKKGLEMYSEDDKTVDCYNELLSKSSKRQLGKENGGIVEYIPAAPENKKLYTEFMNSLGIEVRMPEPKAKAPVIDKIAKGDYPEFPQERNAGFKTFVAYDLETTGLHPDRESIIEIGAVRVVDGEVTENEKFIFRTFVHPYKRRISEEITALTGITNEMVRDAPQMWDAFNAFADFIGDDILVGFNNRNYDDRMLMRAGRYAKRIIRNKSFDVMVYADNFKGKLGSGAKKFSLKELSELLDIKNPQAHRAVADAVTTARIYLKLLEMDDIDINKEIINLLEDDWS